MPQDVWSDKDERQYKHIKKSEAERGRSEEDAEEIAARTVNKQRSKEGRTKGEGDGGTGNPNTPYEERTRKQLYNLAKARDITGRGDMTKGELIEALRERN